jgi:hypothetical protein
MIKVGVIIENGQIKSVCQLENADVSQISFLIANLELVKSNLVYQLAEMTRHPSNTPLVKKEVGKATTDPTPKVKKFVKPADITNCSDKQYATLKKAEFDDMAIRSMSQKEISKSIGAYFDSLKDENI